MVPWSALWKGMGLRMEEKSESEMHREGCGLIFSPLEVLLDEGLFQDELALLVLLAVLEGVFLCAPLPCQARRPQ